MGEGKVHGSGRPTAGDLALALAAAVIVLALGLGGAERSRVLTMERRAIEDHEVLADLAVGLAARVQRDLQLLGSRTSAGTVTDVALIDADGSERAPLPPTVSDALATADAASLLARARDTGDSEISGPLTVSTGVRHLMANAVYDQMQVTPRGSAERRARVQGYRVAPLDVGGIVEGLAPPGMAVSIQDSGTELAPDGPEAAGLPTEVIELEGRRFVLQAGNPDRVALTAPTVALTVGGVIAAALAAAGVLVAGRKLREQREQIARAEEQVQLIGEVAPLVQQSLELADVLPAVAVQLVDHFGLAGVRLAAGGSARDNVELFSYGARPIGAKPVLAPPPSLGAGESLTMALQRGGRSVALLQLVAGRRLDDTDLHSLRAVTELITAAVVNASLYASQQEAVRRLRDLDGLKTVFLSTASHELRTPATAIGGFASLLSGSWDRFDDGQRREFAARIAANARALGEVVQDLLDFSLLDRGRVHLTIHPVDLGGIARSVVDRLGPALPEHEVVCRIDDVPPIAGDTNAIERIVTNLLTNAAKFSPGGSTVTVEVVPAGDGAALLVSDEGTGVPMEEREQIFTRFYRGSGDAVVRTRGVGIGLSVVAELAERMAGHVSIDDAPGGGARFAVRFPPATSIQLIQEADDASTA